MCEEDLSKQGKIEKALVWYRRSNALELQEITQDVIRLRSGGYQSRVAVQKPLITKTNSYLKAQWRRNRRHKAFLTDQLHPIVIYFFPNGAGLVKHKNAPPWCTRGHWMPFWVLKWSAHVFCGLHSHHWSIYLSPFRSRFTMFGNVFWSNGAPSHQYSSRDPHNL